MEWNEWDTVRLGVVIGIIYPFFMSWLYRKENKEK
jgi:hypothetical protein